jgi:hypothetical protein
LKFTVSVPPYSNKSGGLWYCHYLCHALNEIGHTATISFYEPPYRLNFDWNTPLGHDPEAIVIYPEKCRGNPLNAKKVVRYLLAPEDFFDNTPIAWQPTDFKLLFSKPYAKDCNVLFYPISELNTFKPIDAPKKFNTFYVGKGHLRQQCQPLKDCVEITRQWPQEKNELAKILQFTNIFFSYDEMSSTNLDAALCGAMPYFLTKHLPWMQNNELGKYWIYSLDPKEIAQTKENNSTLRPRIIQMRKEYPSKLAEMCNKIEAHFKNVAYN